MIYASFCKISIDFPVVFVNYASFELVGSVAQSASALPSLQILRLLLLLILIRRHLLNREEVLRSSFLLLHAGRARGDQKPVALVARIEEHTRVDYEENCLYSLRV